MNYCKSEFIVWANTFSCGVKPIDDQHKELISLVNEMFNHVTGDEKQEREYFNKVFLKVVNYIRVHFATEEKIMLVTRFSGYNEHKMAHDNFISTVKNYIYNFTSGKRFSLYTFTKFLKNWVLSHIAIMDKQYFEYFRKTAIRNRASGNLNISSAGIRPVEKLNLAQ